MKTKLSRQSNQKGNMLKQTVFVLTLALVFGVTQASAQTTRVTNTLATPVPVTTAATPIPTTTTTTTATPTSLTSQSLTETTTTTAVTDTTETTDTTKGGQPVSGSSEVTIALALGGVALMAIAAVKAYKR